MYRTYFWLFFLLQEVNKKLNTSVGGKSIKVFNIQNLISLANLHSFLDYAKMETVFPLYDQHHRKLAKQTNPKQNLLLEF